MTSEQNSKKTEAQVNKLSAKLDEHREIVSSLPGVHGCGVGFSELGDPEKIVIQIYIFSKVHFEDHERRIKELFEGYPLEVIYHDKIPDSQQD